MGPADYSGDLKERFGEVKRVLAIIVPIFRLSVLAPIAILAIWLAMPSSLLPVRAAEAKLPSGPHILIDANDGAILAGSDIHQRWYPASLTKMMTVYVTLRAIKAGELAAGSPVIISREAIRQPPSKMGYGPGTKLNVDTALAIVIVKSANDVAVALAEAVAGSSVAFVTRMNRQARRLGMTNSHFVNPHGLHGTGQFVSARDLALLAQRLFAEFPNYSKLFAVPALRTATKTFHSYNLLLERFSGADGVKTGFVCASGYNMVASASRGSKRLIAVVLGASSQVERAVRAARLLSDGFVGNVRLADTIAEPATLGTAPRNMRPVLCTEKARAARYEPAAGVAVVNSPFLLPRTTVREPLVIATGNVTAPPSEALVRLNAGKFYVNPNRAMAPLWRPADAPAIPKLDPEMADNPTRGVIPTPLPRPG